MAIFAILHIFLFCSPTALSNVKRMTIAEKFLYDAEKWAMRRES
jgi:hypothetical protein